jgi:hypothetical protein
MKHILIFVIKVYQKMISPILGRNKCRFYPTCSSYSIEAIGKFGALKGGYLSIKRVLKCQPFHPGGVDEVPEKFKF